MTLLATSETLEGVKVILSGAGFAGLCFGYYLYKLAPELRELWRAGDRRTRMETLRLIASPHVAPEIKDEAATLIEELNIAETSAKKREIIPP